VLPAGRRPRAGRLQAAAAPGRTATGPRRMMFMLCPVSVKPAPVLWRAPGTPRNSRPPSAGPAGHPPSTAPHTDRRDQRTQAATPFPPSTASTRGSESANLCTRQGVLRGVQMLIPKGCCRSVIMAWQPPSITAASSLWSRSDLVSLTAIVRTNGLHLLRYQAWATLPLGRTDSSLIAGNALPVSGGRPRPPSAGSVCERSSGSAHGGAIS